VVDENGLFISGPAIVKILEDDLPIRRRLDFSLMITWMLLPWAEW
jgi:hypothetical protein